jgi:hypothetical protein
MMDETGHQVVRVVKGSQMHVLGKVFLGLTIFFGLVNVYLSSVLLKNRTHWHEQIEKRRADFESARNARVDAQNNLRRVSLELDRIKTTWADSWTSNEGGALNLGNATFAVRVGTAQGMPEVVAGSPLREMYLFVEDDAGKSRYLGAFRLQQAQADQSGYSLAREYLYPDEGLAWQQVIPAANAKWRVRESIPSSWRSGFADLDASYAVAMKHLDNEQNYLRIESEQLAVSQGLLDQRYAELNGDPEPPEGASQDVIDGLVLTLRKEETARNARLQHVDELRHYYKRRIDELNGLVQQNQATVNGLPGAQEASTRPDSSRPVATTGESAR